MRHAEAAATLWLRVQESSDLEHIIRECLADVAMIVMQDEVTVTEFQMASIVLCKFIFDHYRICLYTTPDYQDFSRFRNIPLDLALDLLSCLSKAARQVAQHMHQGSRRCLVLAYLRQAFIAGLRSISLRPFTATERSDVSDRIYGLITYWNTEFEIDRDVTTLLINSSALLVSPASVTPEFGHCLDMADRSPSQFFLDTRNLILSKLESSLPDAQDSNNVPELTRLWCDSRLALTSSTYEFLLENEFRKQRDGGRSRENVSEIVEILKDVSAKFHEYMQQLPETFCQQIRMLEPSPHGYDCECRCFNVADDSYPESCRNVSILLTKLIDRLDNRKLLTFNSSIDLNELTSFINHRKEDWLSNDLEDDSYSSVHEGGLSAAEQFSLKAAYVLNCPKMHCVSGDTLRTWIKRYNRGPKTGLDDLSRESELIKTYVQCPICTTTGEGSSKSAVTSARKVTPLSQIFDKVTSLRNEARKLRTSLSESNSVSERVVESDDSADASRNSLDYPDLSHRAKYELENRRSPDTNSSMPTSKRPNRRDTSHSQSTTGSDKVPFSTLLTPDGRHLFVWYKSSVSVLNLEAKVWFHPWRSQNEILKLSTSNAYFAVISNTAMGSKLYVLSIPSGNQKIPVQELSGKVWSLCLSPDGSRLLVTTGRHIRYIMINSGESCLQEIAGTEDVDKEIDSQCICFSVGGERALMATRLVDCGKVLLTIYDTTSSQRLSRIVNLGFNRLLPMDTIRDNGLIQCPCYFDEPSRSTTWMICSATNGGRQFMMRYKETDKSPQENIEHLDLIGRRKDDLGPSIIQAICLPASRDFLLVDDYNHLFVIQRQNRTAKWTSSRFRLKHDIKSSVNTIRHRVTIAANSVQQICIAAIHNGESRQIVYKASANGKEDCVVNSFAIE